MSKARFAISLFAAAALAGLFLWPTSSIRQGNVVPPGSGPTGEGTTRAEPPHRAAITACHPPPQPHSDPAPPAPEIEAEGKWATILRELTAAAASDPNAALVRVAELTEAEERQTALKEVCAVIEQASVEEIG